MKNMGGYILVAAVLGGVAFQWNAKRSAHAEIVFEFALNDPQSDFMESCSDALTTHKMSIIQRAGSYGHDIPNDRACGCIASDLGKLGTTVKADLGVAEDLFEAQILAAAYNKKPTQSQAKLQEIGSDHGRSAKDVAAVDRQLGLAMNSCAKLSRYVDAAKLATAQAMAKWSQCIKSNNGDEAICGGPPS